MAFFVVFWGFELNLTQFNVRPQPPRFFGKRIGDTQEAGRCDQKLMSLSFESGWGSTWPHTLFQVGHLCKQLFVLEAALCLVTPAAVLIQKPHVLYFMSVSSQCNFAQHTKHMQSCCVEVFYFFIFPKSNKYWHRFFFFFFFGSCFSKLKLIIIWTNVIFVLEVWLTKSQQESSLNTIAPHYCTLH